VYHDPSGLIVFHDATNLAAYDIETDAWHVIAQRPDPAMRASLGRPPAVVLLAYDARRDLFVANADNGPLDSHVANPATWIFDPATAMWSQLTSVETAAIRCGWGFAPECGAVVDARTGLAVFFAMDGTQIVTFDGGEGTWQELRRTDGAQFVFTETCDNDTPVYDSVNERIVCRAAWSGVAAIDTGTGTDAQASWLLEPLPRQSPEP
jgi:hypothetical protein